jgi:hypothetical protein
MGDNKNAELIFIPESKIKFHALNLIGTFYSHQDSVKLQEFWNHKYEYQILIEFKCLAKIDHF